jgi:hypothetical protein
MNKLTEALQPPPIAPPPAPPQTSAPSKPQLDFQPMVKDAVKDHKKNRGGLSSAMIQTLQTLYAQDAQNQAQPVQTPNSSLNPGWGGEGR